jgi:CRP-like cAMP-binding protein
MPSANASPVVNQLIAGMPNKQRKQFLAECEPVDLFFGEVLCEPDERYRSAYFPLTGFISLVAVIRGHPPLEMGLIGNEGMLGATLVLGVAVAPLRAVVQGSGSAWRVSSAYLQSALREGPGLLQLLNRYLFVLMAQLSQTAACTRFHEIDARLARWLLMTHDRAHADHFHLTHQYLADMLGVQRSAVTIAAGVLQRKRLISYTRGEINILSRTGLEAASCECYAAVIKDYAQRFA